MTGPRLTVLVVGATGSVGRFAVKEAIKQGHYVRALTRSSPNARLLPQEAQVFIGDLTVPETLTGAVENVDAIVFTHSSDTGGKFGTEFVDYGGVRNVLDLLGSRNVRIAFMSCIGVTNRTCGDYNMNEGRDWKRRSERLIRARGLPYTIVRPGWFDYNGPKEHRLVFLQGDACQVGGPSDGVIAREQVAEVLVRSLVSRHAQSKTFELVASYGMALGDLDASFRSLKADVPGAVDGVHDAPNMQLEREPKRVRDDIESARRRRLLSITFARGA